MTENQPEVDQATGKFIYNYQPRDSEGQFIGKPYRFLYTDHQDLIRQITEAKEHGDRFIYEVKTGKRKLVGEPAVPAPSYQPAPESTEEVERKRREEFRKVAEQEFGAPIDTVREDIKEGRKTRERLEAQNWAMNKQADGYYPCHPNAKKIADYLFEKQLKPCSANYDLAFEELRDSFVKEPQEQAQPADSTQQQAPPAPTQAKPQSTSVIPGQFSGTRPPNRTEKQPLTRERFREINKMSRDQWKKFERTSPKEAEAFLAMKYAQPQQ